MPTEADLRAAMRERTETSAASGTDAGIDVAEVLRRSRARRLPKRIALGGAFTLALAAGVLGIGGIGQLIGQSGMSASTSSVAGDTPSDADGGLESGASVQNAPAARLQFCGGTLAEVAGSETGLVLSPGFAPGTPAGAGIAGTLVLQNTGSGPLIAQTVGEPEITLSQGGIVVWHGPATGLPAGTLLDLAPGESIQFAAAFAPLMCTAGDETGAPLALDLPSLPAGDYHVQAALEVQPLSSAGPVTLVTGPAGPLTLD